MAKLLFRRMKSSVIFQVSSLFGKSKEIQEILKLMPRTVQESHPSCRGLFFCRREQSWPKRRQAADALNRLRRSRNNMDTAGRGLSLARLHFLKNQTTAPRLFSVFQN